MSIVISKPCEHCSTRFERLQNSRRFCTDECRKAAKRARFGLAPLGLTATCLWCSDQFIPKRSPAHYCSAPCRDRAKHQRKSHDPEYVERRRAYSRRYEEENAESLRERHRARRANDPERARAASLAWWRRNKYRAARSWREINPEKHAAKQRRRAQLLAELTPYPIAHESVVAKIEYWGSACWLCKAPFAAVDHVKPISKRGLNIVANMRPICISCNSRKSNRWFGVGRLQDLLPPQ